MDTNPFKQKMEYYMMKDVSSIDWNKVWTEQTDMHNACRGSEDCSSIWEDKANARKFWEMSNKNGHERAKKIISALPVNSTSRVLDIGAGPGGLAIPLCGMVAQVTAVEPSVGMLEVLKENIEESGCDNILCVEKKWEDVDVHHDLVGPYDIVLASFSLGMPDIRGAIESMESACNGSIFLYWFAGDRPWDQFAREIWPQLHGKQYYEMPKCNILLNVLYQMGIYPNMETFTLEEKQSFSSIDEAVEHFGRHLGISTQDEKESIGNYLDKKLKREDGKLVHSSRSVRVKIWWKVKA